MGIYKRLYTAFRFEFLRFVTALKYVALWVFFLLANTDAFAEGSKELNVSPNTGYRAYLNSTLEISASNPFPTLGKIKVYVRAGETLYLGSSAQGIGNGTIIARAPNGSVYTSGTGASALDGRINDRQEEMNGPDLSPFSDPTKYKPFIVNVGAGQDGVWEIDFLSPDYDDSFGGANNPGSVLSSANWTQNDNTTYISAFDVSVRNTANTAFITGRAFVNIFNGYLATFGATFEPTFKVLTKDGYQYDVDNNGQAGNGFAFFVNNKGFRNGTEASYASYNSSANVPVHDPRSVDSGTDVTHKIFFNTPDSDPVTGLPASANTVGGGTTWLLTEPVSPTVSAFKFRGKEGTSNVAGTSNSLPQAMGGYIGFTTNQVGSYVINIDINQDGDFNDPVDRVLTGSAKFGPDSVYWDGLNGQGGKVTGTVTFGPGSMQVKLRAGEVHFPFIDVENNISGMIITRINGVGSPSDIVHWNDANLGGTASPQTGSSSTTNGHKWGSNAYSGNAFGNERGLDTWAYAESTPALSTVSIAMKEANLEVVSIARSENTLCLNEQQTYTVVVRNNGPSDVAGAKFRFKFPAELDGVVGSSSDGTLGAVSAADDWYEATIDLSSLEVLTFTITGTVTSMPAGNSLNVTASIIRPADVNDSDATNTDAAPPTDPLAECDAAPSGVGCNNVKTNATAVVSPNISISNAAITEGSSGGTTSIPFTVTLSAANPACNVIVNYAVTDSTTQADDFSVSSPITGTLTIPAGQISGIISIPLAADRKIETTEHFTIRLSGATGGQITTAKAIGTITDDDNAPVSVVVDTHAAEPGTNGQFIVRFPAGVTSSVPTTVTYTVAGTATSTNDYAALSGTRTIPAGVEFVPIPVDVVNDQIIEGNETVTVTLSGVSSTIATTVTAGTAVMNIVDDDLANNSITLTRVDDAEEPGTPGKFRVSFPAGYRTTVPTTVNYTVSGTATNGADYITLSGSRVIAAGQEFADIDVLVNDDLIIEGDETVTLSNISATNSLGFPFTYSGSPASLILKDNDHINPQLTVTATNASEPGTNGRFRISFPPNVTSTVPTNVSYVIAGSATNGIDYANIPLNAQISAGANYVDVFITVIDDKVIEGNETVTLQMQTATNAVASGLTYPLAPTVASLNDDDNVAPNNFISLTWVNDGAEPGTPLRFRVSYPLGVTSSQNSVISYSVSGTAGSNVDFAPPAGTIIIPATSNEAIITIPVINDNISEPTETVVLTITSAVNSISALTFTPNSPVSADILDDENIGPNNVITAYKIADAGEPGSPGMFRIKFPGTIVSAAATTVTYSVSGTAVNGTDFSALPGSVVIPAGANFVDIPVTVIDDKIIEGVETVALQLSSATNSISTLVVNPGTVVAGLVDDDNATPNNIITLTRVQDGFEGGTQAQFRVSFPPGITSSTASTVNYSVSGTALNGTDYGTLNGTVTIPAGANFALINLPVVDDLIIEGTETASIILTGANNAVAALNVAPGSAVSVDIVDNDNNSPNITLARIRDGAEGGINPQFRVSFPANVTSSVDTRLNYFINGSSTNGVDYTSLSGTVIIPAGANSVDIDVVVDDDLIIEGNETVALTATAVVNAVAPSMTFSPGIAEIATIVDNDNVAPNNVVRLTLEQHGTEDGTPARFRVAFPGGITSSGATTVNYSIGGTAINSTDYANISGTVVIPAGDNFAFITIPIVDDHVIEGDETIALTLTSATTACACPLTTNPGAPVVANVVDNDNTALNTVVTITKEHDGAELGANPQFRISLPSGYTSAFNTTVDYALSGTAVNGTDYNILSGTIVIPAGSNFVFLDAVVRDDYIIEGDETVYVRLTSAVNPIPASAFTVAPAGEVSAILADNDNATPNNVVTLTRVNDGAEGGVAAVFRVSFPAAPNTITSSASTIVSYNVSGSALGNADYAALSGTVTIPAGENSADIIIPIVDDLIIEGTETIELNLNWASNPVAGLTVHPAIVVSANIVDNDDAPPISRVTLSAVKDGSEPSSHAQFKVSLPPGVTSSVATVVKYSVAPVVAGVANPGADYEALGDTVLIPPGANYAFIDVLVKDDNDIEGTETVTLTLTSVSNAVSPSMERLPLGPVSINILDNEDSGVANTIYLTRVNNGTEPGSPAIFRVSYPPTVTSANPTTITYSVGGTATSSVDYEPLSGTVIIPAGTNFGIIEVKVKDDKIIEFAETVTITLASADNGIAPLTLNPAGSVLAYIDDDDNAPPYNIISIKQTQNAGEPNTVGEFVIGYPNGYTSAEDTQVFYRITGTAANGTDVKFLSGTLLIPKTFNSRPVYIEVLDDFIIEGTENITLSITGTSNPISNPPVQAGTASIDVLDNDNTAGNKTITLSLENTGSEPGTDASFRVSFPPSIKSVGDTYVNYSISGTASNGLDYKTITGVAIIPAGSEFTTIPIDIIDDKIIEGTENVVLALTSASNSIISGMSVNSNPVTATIADDDNTGILELERLDDGGEPVTNARFIVRFPTDITRSIESTIGYIVGGTATADKDYRALSGVVKIPAGEEFAYIDAEIINDFSIEPTETITIQLNSINSVSDNIITLDMVQESANIVDDDSNGAGIILTKVSDAAEPGTSAVYRVSYLNGLSSSTPTTVNYTVSGTATPTGVDRDYTGLPVSVQIPADANFYDFTATIVDDKRIESTEFLTLTIQNATNGIAPLTVGPNIGVTASILDDDVLSKLTVKLVTDASEPSFTGFFRIGFEDNDVRSDVNTIVNYTISGTAINGTDHVAIPGSTTILAGQNYRDVFVDVIDDKIIEGLENVKLTITSTSSTLVNPDVVNGTGIVNVIDDDNTSVNNTVTLKHLADGSESGTNARFEVSLPNDITSTSDTRVNYTITGSAVNERDYQVLRGVVIIRAGENSAPIDVVVEDDRIIEGTETVALRLTSAQNDLTPSLNVEPGIAVSANILDNDNIAPYTILEMVKEADGSEPGTKGRIRVGFPAGYSSSAKTEIHYSVGGSAIANQDYTTLSGTVTIPADENSAYIDIDVMNDDIVEGPETVEITLDSVVNKAVPGLLTISPTAVTVDIRDDDFATLTLSSPVTETEGNGGFKDMTFTLTLDKKVSRGFVIDYTTADGTATSADIDYDPISPASQLAFLADVANQSLPITVKIRGDQVIERDENFEVRLGALIDNFGGHLQLVRSAATGVIIDDDNTVANKKLTITKTDGAEGGSDAMFVISFPPGVSADVPTTIPFTLTGTALGDPVADKDYTRSHTGSVTIGPKSNFAQILIDVEDDQRIEFTETVIINTETVSNSRYADIEVVNSPVSLDIRDNDSGTLTISGPITVTEGNLGQKIARFDVTLNKATGTGFNVEYHTTDGTAKIADRDYAGVKDTLFFDGNAGEVHHIDVIVYSDLKIESTEDFSIELSNLSQSFSDSLTIQNSPTRGIIQDDDNTVANKRIIITTVNGAEGGANASVRFSFPDGVSTDGTTTIPYTLAGTAAANGTDYNASPTGNLVILPGENTVQIVLPVVDDTLVEAMENVIASAGLIANDKYSGIVIGNAPQTLDIADNDGAVLAINGPVNIIEDNSGTKKAVFEVTLSNAIGGSFTVNYATANVTASTADNDYVGITNGLLTFAGTAAEKQLIEVSIIGDTRIERDETFQVLLTNLSTNFGNQLTFESTSATGIIVDDDNIPANKVITISPTDGTEGAANGTFVFRLPDNVSFDVPTNVSYTLSGTAIGAGRDYTNATVGSVTIPANSNSSPPLTIAVVNDTALEAPETVVLTTGIITNSRYNGITVANSPSSLTIEDNDNATITVNGPISVTETNAGVVNAVFRVRLSNPTGEAFTLNYATIDGTASAADDDYTPTSGTLSFSGATAQFFDVSVPVKGDLKIEQNETFTLEVTGLSYDFDGRLAISGSPAEGRIIDNDNTAANKRITITKIDGAEGGNDARYRFSFPAGISTDDFTTITYSLSGTADASDYTTAQTGTVLISAGENNTTLILPVIDDAIIESPEIVTLTTTLIENDTYTGITVLNSPLNLAITDNDRGELQLSGPIVVTEGNSGPTLATFTVTLTAATGSPFDIRYNTFDGTARTSDNDYVGKAGTLSFDGEEGEVKEITILVNGDFKIESDEEFNVVLRNLSNSFGGKLTFSNLPAKGQILNDDNGTINITATDGKEGAGGGSFRFSLSPGVYSDKPITIPYTLSGTALGNRVDYQLNSIGSITIPPGVSSVPLILGVIDDAVIEPTELVKISTGIVLSNMPNAILVENSPQQLLIEDNDAAPLVITNPVIKREGNSGYVMAVFDATLPLATASGFTFDYETRDGTATDTDDYTATSGRLVFAGRAGEVQKITVPIKGDINVEEDEIFTINLTSLSNNFDGRLTLNFSTVKGVIHDDDIAPVAKDDFITTLEDTPVTFSLITNDIDLDGIDPTGIAIVTPPAKGSIRVNRDGTVTYTPELNDNGTHRFTYTVKDITGLASNEADVTVTITPVNDPPIAVDDAFYVIRNRSVNENVSRNDSDPDGDNLTFTVITQPAKGILSSFSANNGLFIYTPTDSTFTGFDSFSYRVTDPFGLTDEAAVSVGVQPNASVKLTPSIAKVKEGQVVGITAELSEPLLQDVQVTLGYTGTAEKETDYKLLGNPLTLNIRAGETTTDQKVYIQALKDFLTDPDETVEVNIVSATPAPYLTIESGSVVTVSELGPDDKPVGPDENGNINTDPYISPNGDGLGNERFIINNIDLYPDNEVAIYNRWGNEVFRIKGYNNKDKSFSGVANTGLLANKNSSLPDGVYYFIIYTKVENQPKVNKGYVIVKRQ
jgi:hypothetical protein